MKFLRNKIRIRRDMETSEELISDPFSNVPHSLIHKKRRGEDENRSKKPEMDDNERK